MAEILTTNYSGPRLSLASRSHAREGRFAVILLGYDQRLNMLEWLDTPDKKPTPEQVLPARRVALRT